MNGRAPCPGVTGYAKRVSQLETGWGQVRLPLFGGWQAQEALELELAGNKGKTGVALKGFVLPATGKGKKGAGCLVGWGPLQRLEACGGRWWTTPAPPQPAQHTGPTAVLIHTDLPQQDF